MRYAFLALIALVLTACGGGGGGGSGDNSSSNPTPARLVIAHSGIGPTPVTVPAPVAQFEMGDLKTTTTYLFAVRNTGQTAATNVTVAVNHPDVTVSPAVIASVPPTPDGGLGELVQVTVVHGKNAMGTGAAPTLEPGKLFFTLSAYNSATIATATIGADIVVANFQVSWLGTNTPLLVPMFSGTMNVSGAGRTFCGYSAYYVGAPPSRSTAFYFTNTGTVTVTVRTLVQDPASSAFIPQSVVTVLSGNSVYLYSDVDGSGNPLMRFSVDPAGTAFKTQVLPPADNSGVWYGMMLSAPAPAG